MLYLVNPNNINHIAKSRRLGFTQSTLYLRRRSFWLRYGRRPASARNSFQQWVNDQAQGDK